MAPGFPPGRLRAAAAVSAHPIFCTVGWHGHAHRLEHLPRPCPATRVRTRKRFPPCSTSTYCTRSRSRRTSAHSKAWPRAPQPRLQLVPQQQRQERAEHVPADRLVTLVVDRPRLQQRLARTGTIAPPSTAACTARPPPPPATQCSSAAPRCRRNAPPRPTLASSMAKCPSPSTFR